MGDSDSVEITLDVSTEAMPDEKMEEIMSRLAKCQSHAFSSKVMSELMEMHNLMKMLGNSSVDDGVQFRCNKKMRELMRRQFCSSVDDMPFSENILHIMMYRELYEAICDKNADADRFVCVLEQVCTQNEVDLATIFNNQVSPTGDSLLHVAAEHGSEQIVRLIAFHYPKLLYKTNMRGDTPLHVAARAKNLLAIIILLDMDKHFMTTSEEEAEFKDKGELLMLRNNYVMTALHEAVLAKDYSVVLFLLFAHQQSDLTSYWTWNYYYGCKSPMYLAAQTTAEDILYLLLMIIPIPSGKAISNGDSPLHAAISERDKVLLKMIVDTRQELLYQRDENRNTPLHYAAYAGYVEGICIMLERSPMVAFQRNLDGNLPIHLACEKGKVEVVKKLLEIEWSSNAGLFLNNNGQNILHIAAMKGQTNVIKYLLKQPKIHHHDTINGRDVNGETPLHLASRELRLWTLLLLLRDKITDVNIVNNEGFTARDVVWMQRRIPMTRQELLAHVILKRVGVPLKANMLGIQRKTSINKEWNVKHAANVLIVVAVLIATVSFAAGFAIPGGFYSSDSPTAKKRGMALLSDQTLFKIFMAFNTIAMYSSTIASIMLLRVPLADRRMGGGAYSMAVMFVCVALVAMPISFLAAIRLIVSNNTLLADVISALGIISIFFIISSPIIGFFPLGLRSPVFRQIGGLFIRILIVLFYGLSDASISDLVGKVNEVE